MSSEVIFPPEHIAALEARVKAGETAKELWAQFGPWLEQTIFGPLDDEALSILRKATTEDDRLKAQHMTLAVVKVRGIITGLINQANGAKAELTAIATQEGANHG